MSEPSQPPASSPAALMVCFCYGVPEDEIRKAIQEGAATLEDIQNRLGASTGCGGCAPEVRKIIAEMLAKKPR